MQNKHLKVEELSNNYWGSRIEPEPSRLAGVLPTRLHYIEHKHLIYSSDGLYKSQFHIGFIFNAMLVLKFFFFSFPHTSLSGGNPIQGKVGY